MKCPDANPDKMKVRKRDVEDNRGVGKEREDEEREREEEKEVRKRRVGQREEASLRHFNQSNIGILVTKLIKYVFNSILVSFKEDPLQFLPSFSMLVYN